MRHCADADEDHQVCHSSSSTVLTDTMVTLCSLAHSMRAVSQNVIFLLPFPRGCDMIAAGTQYLVVEIRSVALFGLSARTGLFLLLHANNMISAVSA